MKTKKYIQKDRLAKKLFNPVTTLQKIKYRLFLAGFIILIKVLFGLDLLGFGVILTMYLLVEAHYQNKSILEFLKGYAITFLFVAVLVGAFHIAGGFGILAIFLLYVLLTCFVIWTKKELYINGIKSIETRLWGKPLEKKYWKKNEFKNTKLKFVWRKTK